ncbi:MAG: PQQ-dependent sugar dehydrogenase [Caldilineaceae bacterium]
MPSTLQPERRLRARYPAGLLLVGWLLLAACGSATSDQMTVEEATAPADAAATTSADVATLPTPTPELAAAPGTAPNAAPTALVSATAANIAVATTAAPPADAPTLTVAVTELVAEGLDRPLGLVNAGDGSGRLFVIEKAGRVQVIAAGAAAAQLFLNLSDRVGSSSSEQGLLGLAFAPDFAESGRFYVNYTNRQGNTTISRLQLGADGLGDASSEEILLTIAQPAPNHNGGHLLFGPDGMLWVGTGDGGAANDRFDNGQNPATLLGKMLRLDVSGATGYAIPADNPWVEATWNGQEVADEIWAVGLRNPWRYSFDRQTGDLWIGDVGQNLWEEVNRVPAGSFGGLNFGWPIQEASTCFQSAGCDTAGLEQPVLEYDHASHCSITGGAVYRGVASPAALGAYIFGDYCSGFVWAGIPQGDGTWVSVELLRAGVPISSFGEDEAGELYLVDFGGAIYRLRFS